MEIMDLTDARQLFEKAAHLGRLDAGRDRGERHVDRIPKQPPGAPNDDARNHQTDGGIEPEPSCHDNDDPGQNHAE